MWKDIPLATLSEKLKLQRFWQRRGMVLVLLALIVIGVYSRIAITREYDWIWSPDLVNQVYPWMELQAAAWQSGQVPLWDPYLWGGQPLHGQVQPGVTYPLNWLLFALPQRDGYIRYGLLDWYFVLLHIMAASFAYLMARGLRASKPASLVCGLMFSLGGFMGRTDWPQMMNSALWTPLVLLAILRAPASGVPYLSAALGGLALGIAFLSGHHQVPIFLSIAAGLLWLAQAMRGGLFRPRVIVLAAVFFVCAGLIAAVQVLPSLEYGREAVRWVGAPEPATWKDAVPYYVHDSFASKPHRLLGIVIPNIFEHYDHYLGFVGLLLAVVGVAASLRNWETRALTAIGVVSLFAAMGGTTAIHGILYALVPLFEKARNPAAISALFTIAMAVLAAFGVDAIRERSASAVARMAARGLVMAAGALLLVGLWLHYGSPQAFPVDGRFLGSALCALLLAGLLVAWRDDGIPKGWMTVGLVFLITVELSMSALLPFPSKQESSRPGAYRMRFEYADIANYVKALPGHQRGMVNGDEIRIAIGDLYQTPMFEGFTASVPTAVWELGMVQRRVLELYGVKTWIASQPLYEGQRELAEFRNGVKAWELESAFPRAWIAHETVSFESVAAFRSPFDEGQFSSTRVAPFVGEAPPLPGCSEDAAGADIASIEDYRLNSVLIRARSSCGGLLVLSDNAFPGWNAYIDGQSAEILRPFHALRGVLLQPGEHTIVMHYSPASVRNGALLSVLGLLLVAGIGLWDRQRPRDLGVLEATGREG